MKNANLPKLLVILGPTATGKSDLAVQLAKKYNGEVISADSRQVYKGLDIGTGKIKKEEMQGVTHHMLDVISPQETFTVAKYQKQTQNIIKEIVSRNKLPIICGGTGLYIQSIVDGVVFPEVPPNKDLREELEKKTLEELVVILKKLDYERLKDIDKQNPVRLIRAIEIATALGKVPKMENKKSEYDFIQIGLTLPTDKMKEKIHTRLLARIDEGMIQEAERLNKDGLSFERMRELGLEYRYLADYLDKKVSMDEMTQKLENEIWHYAKRQMTWFKRDKEIKWFAPTEISKIEMVLTS